ncbi:MAG TPA: bifunctional [glutamate--ammonia ligase]-adenylyl-L-tyrosine phosphorylase/[glutamate--ammonia-ligase] adenylyltransferase [Candidatus Hydrogenedens sp.]|nr:bifunctional [glutamate--ammonia ligase]-adenylyl-L-tyrosine phosphorylase/[glutamate--ammonia-ligase] adenylyltransferase [Candidatus Hydrogenedens sp.]
MENKESIQKILNKLTNSVHEDLNFLYSISLQDWQNKLDSLICETSNPERVIVYLTQFIKKLSEQNLSIHKYLQNQKSLRLFERIFSQSPFLSETVINNPEYLDELLADTTLSRALTKHEWLSKLGWNKNLSSAELMEYLISNQFITPKKDWDLKKIMNHLRKLHKKALLRITTRDIVEHQEVKSIAEDLSSLADAHLEICLNLNYVFLEQKYGIPINYSEIEQKNIPSRFVIMGLGKLGGRELNFNSDIDLIFVYDGDGETQGGINGQITNREFYSKLGEYIIKFLSEHTEEGMIYRVDMRLRPYGKVGALAESLSNSVEYYYQYGRAWERQALVKCRPCAGDINLGNEFLEMMRPFVFPKFFDDKTLEDIHQTKLMVEKQVAEQGQTNYEVKLGRGGIRDIEFTVQLLQLLNGGRHPELRMTNTIEAIYQLMEKGYLKPFDAETLMNNYCFLREVEHRLQIEYGTQKHTLPQKTNELDEFARRLGYTSGESFWRIYKEKTQEVRTILEQFVAVKSSGNLWVYDLVSAQSEGKEGLNKLKSLGFENVEKARDMFRELANGPEQSPHSLHVRENFIEIIPFLCEEFKKTGSLDTALEQFYSQVSRLLVPGVVYSLLKENHNLCSFFVTLTSRAPALAEIWIKEPSIIEIFLQEELIDEKSTADYLSSLLQQLKKSVFPESAHYRLKDSEWLRIALGDLLDKFTIEEVCEQLTLLAEVILQDIMDESLIEVEKKNGNPPLPFAILGLGKIGGGEMTFGSDLDLIFVMDDTYPNDSTEKYDDKISPVEYFSDVSSRIIKRLKEPTNFGILYDIDTRLRPYGSKGVLVITLTQLKEYYEYTADIWEKMALMKARVVAEKGTFAVNLQETIKNLSFYCSISVEDIKRSEEIRLKMVQQTNPNNLKKSEGGIAELEYAVRWWQRMKVEQCPQLATPSVIRALNILNKLYSEQSQQWTFLKETFDIYIKILNRHRLFTGIRSSTLSEQTLQFLPQLLPEVNLSPSPIEFLNNTKNKVHQFYVKTLQEVKQWLNKKQ